MSISADLRDVGIVRTYDADGRLVLDTRNIVGATGEQRGFEGGEEMAKRKPMKGGGKKC